MFVRHITQRKVIYSTNNRLSVVLAVMIFNFFLLGIARKLKRQLLFAFNDSFLVKKLSFIDVPEKSTERNAHRIVHRIKNYSNFA